MAYESRGDAVLVTVIVPMFNQTHNLPGLISNLKSQTISDSEFLLIDDGSTDGTYDRACELAANDTRFRVLTKENTGAGATRNYGIDRARGKYLFFLDADDRIAKPGTLNLLCAKAEEKDVQICGGSIQFMKRGIEVVPTMHWRPDGEVMEQLMGSNGLAEEPFEYFAEEGVYEYRDYQYDAGFTRFVYLKDLLVSNEIRFPERRYFEDPIFLIRAMDAAGCFAVVPEITYVYTIGWHPVRRDEAFFLETIEGIRQNLNFSREHGYRRLHRITQCSRLGQLDDMDLVLDDSNIDQLRSAVRCMWDAFDSDFAEGDRSAPVPSCVLAVDSYGSDEWNLPRARIWRIKRRTRAKLVAAIKGSRAMKRIQSIKKRQA